jgi:hypothetical protein
MARQCANCGHLADEYDKFCATCGSELPAIDEAAYETGVLGLRTASEGDSAPIPTVDESTVGGLAEGHGVLVVLRGPQEGVRFDLDPSRSRFVVGRSQDCDLFLDDVTVSRHHADLLPDAGGWRLTDVGSLNGSYVNRRRIESQLLTGGDEVQIGKYRFVYLAAVSSTSGEMS